MFAELIKFHQMRSRFESALEKSIDEFGKKTKLRDAIEYVLKSGGKRVRPLITLLVADTLGFGLDVMPSALGIEYFHTASLLVDDLPCMDDENERRGKPSVHKIYGEDVAILGSLSLIGAGYAKIAENGNVLRKTHPNADHVVAIMLEIGASYFGIHGAAGGQFIDLHPPKDDIETAHELILKKTSTVFEMAFLGGWSFGGGDLGRIEDVKQMGKHFGLAFQIADDINDYEEDIANKRPNNLAILLGKEKASEEFRMEIECATELLSSLGLDNPLFHKMISLLESQVPV